MNPLSSVGTGELILVLIIALIFLGPERLPEIARSAGKTIRQFRNALQNMSSEFGEEMASVQKISQDIQEGVQAVKEVRNLPQTLVGAATAPLVEAMEPIKSTVEETKKVVEAASAPVTTPAQSSMSESEKDDSPAETQVPQEDDSV